MKFHHVCNIKKVPVDEFQIDCKYEPEYKRQKIGITEKFYDSKRSESGIIGGEGSILKSDQKVLLDNKADK